MLDNTLYIDIPKSVIENMRYSKDMIEKVRQLAIQHFDHEIVEKFNQQGLLSCHGKPFTVAMIKWIRHKHKIPIPQLKESDELTVKEVGKKFDVSNHVVRYWIDQGVVEARNVRKGRGVVFIKMNPQKEKELNLWVSNSSQIQKAQEKNKKQK